jgi:RNA polymerase sigma-70 factor, ECF subfamily
MPKEHLHFHVNGLNGSPGPHWTDEALIRAYGSGEDQSAFDELHARYEDWVFKRAKSFVGETDAKDVSQEVILYLWRKIPMLESPYNVKGLLSTAVHNKCIDILRRQKRCEFWDEEKLDMRPAKLSNTGTESDSTAFWANIKEVLTHGEYIVLQLRYREELNLSEIARREGIPVGTIKWRCQRALKKLQLCKIFQTF